MLLEQHRRLVCIFPAIEAAADGGEGGEEVEGFEVGVHWGLDEVSRRESVGEEGFLFGIQNGVVIDGG